MNWLIGIAQVERLGRVAKGGLGLIEFRGVTQVWAEGKDIRSGLVSRRSRVDPDIEFKWRSLTI